MGIGETKSFTCSKTPTNYLVVLKPTRLTHSNSSSNESCDVSTSWSSSGNIVTVTIQKDGSNSPNFGASFGVEIWGN